MIKGAVGPVDASNGVAGRSASGIGSPELASTVGLLWVRRNPAGVTSDHVTRAALAAAS